jgi:hypothetical protein
MEVYDGKRYVNKGELKQRGWSKAAISALLVEPDKTRRNHLYKNTKLITLYWEDRVIKMEKTDEYRHYMLRKKKDGDRRKKKGDK